MLVNRRKKKETRRAAIKQRVRKNVRGTSDRPRLSVFRSARQAAGKLLAERANAAGVNAVVFDRNGYDFHGRVRAAAHGAREGGLKF